MLPTSAQKLKQLINDVLKRRMIKPRQFNYSRQKNYDDIKNIFSILRTFLDQILKNIILEFDSLVNWHLTPIISDHVFKLNGCKFDCFLHIGTKKKMLDLIKVFQVRCVFYQGCVCFLIFLAKKLDHIVLKIGLPHLFSDWQ